MSRHTDTLIIGGGVIGLACARELLAAGRSVRIVERATIGGGSSWGNCGLVTPSHAAPVPRPGLVAKTVQWMLQPDAPLYVRPRLDLAFFLWGLRFAARCRYDAMVEAMHGRAALLNSSRDLMAEVLADDADACEWDPAGLAMIYTTDAGWRGDDIEDDLLAGIDLAPEPWSRERLHAGDPALHPDVIGGRFFACDAHLRPDRLVHWLHERVRAAGAVIEEGCAVERFDGRCPGQLEVWTNRGVFTSDATVLATGAWSGPLGRTFGVSLPIQPGKGYTITAPRPDPCPVRPYLCRERAVAVTPWGSGLRLGGTMEFNGYSTELNERRLAAIERGASEYLRAMPDTRNAERWYGWRPMTPDGLPIIDRASRTRNLFIAAGHNMLGVSMAAATGRLVRELVTDVPAHIDPRPYRLDRF